MAKVDMTKGPGAGRGLDELAAKRVDYRAPKLTVVGTVQDLTLGVSNVGGPDGLYKTGGGG